ncbi:MAG: thermonuclease family protein [Gammaproteobacteria bacterium]|nr:thermonuclease family protein [Gammaproteobacteria bacterium]
MCALALLSGPADARDMISGVASVIDGDTLEIRGTRIRLHAIDAPESSQTCQRPNGNAWRCGQQAALGLADKIGKRPISCKERGQGRYGRSIAVCHQGKIDLNAWLVSKGWAVAFRRYSDDYVAQEEEAKVARIGVWKGTFEMPWDYRARVWSEAADVAPDPDCPIKGNINRTGERIYHTPWGSRDYHRTKFNERKGERWFCDEGEAVRAGWRAPRD